MNCPLTFLLVLKYGRTLLEGAPHICRYLARAFPDSNLYGSNGEESTLVDLWLQFADALLPHWNAAPPMSALSRLNKYLQMRTWLAGYHPTLADYAMAETLSKLALDAKVMKPFGNVTRWLDFIGHNASFVQASKKLGLEAAAASKAMEAQKDGKKPVMSAAQSKAATDTAAMELPGAVEGQVCTRFPPEASGFLHIGHVKAALVNEYYARKYKGKLILRFDDTNPAKEKEEYEESIVADLKTLGVIPDVITHTSDSFDIMFEMMEKLIKEGKAYCDKSDVVTMREQRMARQENSYRSNTVEENLRLWREMIAGSEEGCATCVRGKIDMTAVNGCMRDPVFFRCNTEVPHVRTGTKYKCYPTYDFACPIVDSIEGVTHALRTTEYHDRNEQFQWVCAALKIRCPAIHEFSRVNFAYTLMSKRKLTWFVTEGLVEGWNDPRFPTLQGIMRRGLTVEAVRIFTLAQGASKSIMMMEWDKIWAINKAVIDPLSPRYTGIFTPVTVTLSGEIGANASLTLPLHPKTDALGSKTVPLSSTIVIELDDANAMSEGEEITLMGWGNCIILGIERDGPRIVGLSAELHLDGDFKKTKLKVCWLPVLPSWPSIQLNTFEFDHLINKKKIEEDDSVERCITPQSKVFSAAIGEENLLQCPVGSFLQLQRRGYYRVDAVNLEARSMDLFFVPDGRVKAMSKLSVSVDRAKTAGKAAN